MYMSYEITKWRSQCCGMMFLVFSSIVWDSTDCRAKHDTGNGFSDSSRAWASKHRHTYDWTGILNESWFSPSEMK